MGIPGLKTWVYKRYPEAFVKTLPDPQEGFTDVYIDMAAQFHMVLRKARNESHLFRLLHRRLEECLTIANPQRRVVFALDGPAPLAKLVEQRNRRKKEAFKEERIHAQPSSSSSSASASSATTTAAAVGTTAAATTGTGAAVPHMALTTGTTLMLDIHQCLISFIVKQLAKPNRAHLHFELSDSRVCGEGELKILARLLQKNVPPAMSSSLFITNNANNRNNNNNNNNTASRERHLVIGGDSDLLLMVMASGRDHVYVAPNLEFPRRYKGGGGGKSNPFNTPASTAIFSRDAAVAHWRKTHLNNSNSSNNGSDITTTNTNALSTSQLDITSLALDLSLLAIVSSGNDYLPGVAGLNLGWWGSRPGLWDLYLDMRQREEWAGQSLVMRTCLCTSADIFLDDIENENTAAVITELGDGTTTSSNSEDEEGGEFANLTASQRRRRRRRKNKTSFPACENLANMTVSINRPMLAALFKRYHEQRNLAGGAPPSKTSNSSSSSSGGKKKSTIGGVKKLNNNKNGSPMSIWNLGAAPKDDASFYKFDVPIQSGIDIENYVQCLEWVLHMYSTGTVADWRLAYDAPTPDLVTFMQQLYDTSNQQPNITSSRSSSSSVSLSSSSSEEEEEEGDNEDNDTVGMPTSAITNGYSSDEPPLIPAACALALLPRTGRHLIAPPLRPLMDPESVLYDLYHVCQECKTLGKKMTAVQKSYTLASLEVSTLQGKYDLVKNADDQKKAEELGRTLEHAEKKYAKLKAKLATFSREKTAHMAEMHPQKAFPIEALEKAVAEISPAAYSDAYRRLAYFGEEFVFFNNHKALQKSPIAASSSGQPQQQQQQGELQQQKQGTVVQQKPEWVRECIKFAQKNRIQLADISPVRRRQLHPFPYMDKSLSSTRIGSMNNSMNGSGSQNQLQPQQQGGGGKNNNATTDNNSRNTGMLVKDSLGPIARMACQLLPQRRRNLLLKNQSSGAAALLKQSALHIRTFFG